MVYCIPLRRCRVLIGHTGREHSCIHRVREHALSLLSSTRGNLFFFNCVTCMCQPKFDIITILVKGADKTLRESLEASVHGLNNTFANVNEGSPLQSVLRAFIPLSSQTYLKRSYMHTQAYSCSVRWITCLWVVTENAANAILRKGKIFSRKGLQNVILLIAVQGACS